MNITMPRGDIQMVTFTVTYPDESQDVQLTEIYFTVKKTFNDKNFIFQKKLSAGQIELIDNATYQFTIESGDTDNMSFGRYVFDIELVGDDIKHTEIGDFILTQEVTYVSNE